MTIFGNLQLKFIILRAFLHVKIGYENFIFRYLNEKFLKQAHRLEQKNGWKRNTLSVGYILV